MIAEVRSAYNKAYTADAYERFKSKLSDSIGDVPTFRIAETPIFLPPTLRDALLASCARVSEVICDAAHLASTESAILHPYWSVPGERTRPLFLQYDYAICRSEFGLTPYLIELQGFPTLYSFQALLAENTTKHMPVPKGYTSYFEGVSKSSYTGLLRRAVLNGHEPAEVILLEINPEQQNTRVDFYATREALGIETVGLHDLIREGEQLFYIRGEKRQRIRRIYNRVILDELLRTNLDGCSYTLREEVDVEWAGHPDWFLRISKHTLPALGHLPNVPETRFADAYDAREVDLSRSILKPLFSFSGEGVNLHPTEADIEALEHPSNWIIQEKVNYEPVLETPSGMAKCEVRMMLIWLPDEEHPRVVNNLVRITKGEMTGVKYNKDKDWVGASVGLHQP